MSAKQSLNQAHFYKFNDWEKGLDSLFISCIHQSRFGLAIFSDTARRESSDANGHPIKELSRRLKQGLDHELNHLLKNINRDNFNELLRLEKRNEPEVYDFFRVQKTALPNNALINFIHGEGRNAILVFSPISINKEMIRIINAINAVVDPKERSI